MRNKLKIISSDFYSLTDGELKNLKNKHKIERIILCSEKDNINIDFLKNSGLATQVIKRRIPHSFISSDDFFLSCNTVFRDTSLQQSAIDSLFTDDFTEGDLLVHTKHGIGQFVRFKQLKIGDQISEFLEIAYADNTKLMVPIHDISVLSRYLGNSGSVPKLDKIGGQSWENKKSRASKNIVEFAKKLLDLYAKRKSVTGYSFHRNSEFEDNIENKFRFVLTKGQKDAINDVLTDLYASYPMDRLICGDVSFGKTEVALRAALRVAGNRMQTALLCPTTILALQHYKTFTERFRDLPVTIKLLTGTTDPIEKKR